MNLNLLSPTKADPAFLDHCKIRSFLAGVGGIQAGQAFYVTAGGLILPTSTAAGGQYQWRGIALNSAGYRQAVDGLIEGYCGSFDLSAVAFDSAIYLSDTAGALATAQGTNLVIAGRVCPSSDIDPGTWAPSKLLYVKAEMTKNW